MKILQGLACALGVLSKQSERGLFLVSMLILCNVFIGWFVVHVGVIPLLLLISVLLFPLLLFLKWPTYAIICLMVASALNRYTVEIYGLSMKAEHIVVLLLATMILTQIAISRGRKLVLDAPGKLIIVYAVLSFFSSVLNDPEYSLRFAGLVSLVTLSYLVTINLVVDRGSLETAYNTYVWLTVFEAAFGIVCVMVYYTIGLNLGIQIGYHSRMGWLSSPYGSFWESNIFGQYSLIGALMLLAWLTYSDHRPGIAKIAFGVFVTLVALLLSLARAAWIGFIAGVLILVICRIHSGRGLTFANLVVMFLGASITIMVLKMVLKAILPGGIGTSKVGELVLARFATFKDIFSDPTLASRLFNYRIAFRFWTKQPLFGWGSGGFAPLFSALYSTGTPWVGNWVIQALFDTGAIGLCVIMIIFVRVVYNAFRSLRYARDPILGRILLSLLVSFLGFLIASLATSATWLAFTWVHMGLLASATRIVSMSSNFPHELEA